MSSDHAKNREAPIAAGQLRCWPDSPHAAGSHIYQHGSVDAMSSHEQDLMAALGAPF